MRPLRTENRPLKTEMGWERESVVRYAKKKERSKSMKNFIKKCIKKHGNLLCLAAAFVVPMASKGCFIKFYQPEEPENLSDIGRRK